MGKPLNRKSRQPPKARAKNRALYTAVGEAITHWSDMEGRLVRIAAKLLDTQPAKVGVVLYSVANFHLWLTIIDELFVHDGTFPRSLKAWRKVQEDIKAENNIRTRLAHHAASLDVPGELRPHKFDLRIKTLKASPALTAPEIREFTKRIRRIYKALIALQKMMKQPTPSR